MKTRTSQKAGTAIYDLMSDSQPRTKSQIALQLNISRETVNAGIRWLRNALADTEDINLVADPRANEEWLFQLVGELDAARPWVTNRIGDSRTRLTTIKSVVASLPGREAQIMARGISRILEDLADLEEVE